MNIRRVRQSDLSRIAEIFVFNNRINYFPIFKDAEYSFGELQVVTFIEQYLKKEDVVSNIYVYEDGVVKGFLQMAGREIYKLYVDVCFQNEGIGHQLIEAVKKKKRLTLHVFEKNTGAMAFYLAEGFKVRERMTEKETGERECLMVYEDGQ